MRGQRAGPQGLACGRGRCRPTARGPVTPASECMPLGDGSADASGGCSGGGGGLLPPPPPPMTITNTIDWFGGLMAKKPPQQSPDTGFEPGALDLQACAYSQHGASLGVGAFVASFVSTECPMGRGMWGILGKALAGNILLRGGGGGGGLVPPRNWGG